MKSFLVTYDTNYGLAVMIVNAESKGQAKRIAIQSGAWDGYTDVEEILGIELGVEHNVPPTGG